MGSKRGEVISLAEYILKLKTATSAKPPTNS